MQFVKPIPFAEAVDKLGRRTPIGSALSASEWADVPVELRELAFFSSRVESVRVLQRGRDAINDFLANNREDLGNGVTALKVGSRQQFVDLMQEFLAREGIERGEGGLTDISSETRLNLVFNVQTQQVQDYGYWKQGQDADVLNEFPAQRFIRVRAVEEPRMNHAQFEDQVFLKNSPIWSREINQDFGVPWGPWGWGCGHDVEDVDRDEAERRGLLQPGQPVRPDTTKFVENMQASARGLDPDLLAKLKGAFGDQIVIDGDTIRWATSIKRQQFAAPMPTNPAPQGTLEDALVAAGMDKPSDVTAENILRFIEELKEANPLKSSEVVKNVAGGSVAQQLAFASSVDAFLQFIPPDKVRSLHKLNLTLRTIAGENGHYSPGVGITVGEHLDPLERTRVVYHELTHWLHMNGPETYKKAIRDHFRERTKGERTQQLPGYSSRGKRDKWYDAYAGRIYSSSIDSEKGDGLEVPTRYLELLADPEKLARLWRDETFRETMKVVLTVLF